MIKERRKTSVFYTKYTDNEIKQLVKDTSQIGELIRMHDMCNQGSNSRTLRTRLDALGVDYSHWVSHKALDGICTKIPNDVLFCNNGIRRTGIVKLRVYKEALIDDKCNICGCLPEWNNKKLVLILDHIDGNNTNNELSNLQLVCPNCNSQLDTHAGKNTKHAKRGITKYYCKCGNEKCKKSKQCASCSGKSHRKANNRPSKEILKEMVSSLGYSAVGRRYGVSDNAVRKWLN